MNLATIINGVGGFAGGLAGALQQQQGQSELGDALSSLFGGGGQSSGGSSPMGGSSQPSMIPLLSGSGQGQGGSFQGQTNLGLPTAAGGAPGGMGAGPLAAIAAAAKQPGTAQPGGGIGSDAVASQNPPQQSPQQQNIPSPVGATQQAGSPPAGQTAGAAAQIGRGPLTLSSLVGAIKQRNPNISGTHLARAVEKAMPLLSMEGLQQYRSVAQQLQAERMQDLQADRQDRSADRKQGMKDRLQMANDRIQEQSSRHAEDIQVKLKGLQQAKDLKEARGYAQDLRSAIKDKLEATNHQIQMQYNLTDDQKAELYKQAQSDAQKANEQLDQLLSQKGKGGKEGGKTAGENDQKNNAGAQTKVDIETEKKNAEAAIKQMPDKADAIKRMYKERTGQDLGG